MTCASCGHRVAPGARYCVHCGAEQSMPTPIAVAASIARRSGREAANAADAESTATVASIGLPGRAPSERVRERREANAAPNDAANSDHPRRPAYADAPSRRLLAIAVIASLAVVAIALGAYAAWRIDGEHGDVAPESSVSAAAAARPSASAPPTAEVANAASESATPATQAPAAPVQSTPSAQAAPADTATGPASDASAPVEIRPLPPHPVTSRPHVAQANKAGAPMATTKAAEPPAARSQADTASLPVTHAHVSAASTVAAAHSADRWQRLDEEIAQCTRADFITRVICGQRARFRYCDGYWGKVAQCPGSPSTADRGQ